MSVEFSKLPSTIGLVAAHIVGVVLLLIEEDTELETAVVAAAVVGPAVIEESELVGDNERAEVVEDEGAGLELVIVD